MDEELEAKAHKLVWYTVGYFRLLFTKQPTIFRKILKVITWIITIIVIIAIVSMFIGEKVKT
jgi:hypothetical protein